MINWLKYWLIDELPYDSLFISALFNEAMVQLETMLPVETNVKVYLMSAKLNI